MFLFIFLCLLLSSIFSQNFHQVEYLYDSSQYILLLKDPILPTKYLPNRKTILRMKTHKNVIVDKTRSSFSKICFIRVTIFSFPKRWTFFDNNYYQPYKLFCKAGKIFLNICWTLTAFDNYILIISTNTAV